METCSLCKSIKEDKYRIFMENDHAIAIVILMPQLEGHCMVIPKRHVIELDELNPEEAYSLNQLLQKARRRIDEVFECSSTALLNGPKQKTQNHVHYQIFPFKNIGFRELVSKYFKVPIYLHPSKEENEAIANKLK